MNIFCTSCEKKLTVPDTALGKKIRCPACQTVFVATEGDIAEAIAPQPIKRAGPPPPLVREAIEPAPPKKESRRPGKEEPEPFTPIQFRAIVKNKTDALKKGNYAATLDEEGIVLKVSKKESLDVPVGTPVEYDGKNMIDVEIEGDWVKMALMRQRTYNNRFAQAVADFMNRDLRSVDVNDYVIPWTMFILVVLPWGGAIITLGGIPQILICAGISAANYAIINKEEWTPGLRITLASLLTFLVYVAAIALLILVVLARARF
jgi:LSD1 subclass zinc finger protein